MNDTELQKLISALSDKDLRKWCLETAIAQVNMHDSKALKAEVGFESAEELKVPHIELMNAYYAFISTGKTNAKIDTSNLLLSATKLLAARDIKMHTTVFNKKLIAAGILERREGMGGNGMQKYVALTEKGLEYGNNKIWPQNKEVTQPLYYDGKFDELLKVTGIKN